jgi:hypothetical protein
MAEMREDGIGKLSPSMFYLPLCNYPCEVQNIYGVSGQEYTF